MEHNRQHQIQLALVGAYFLLIVGLAAGTYLQWWDLRFNIGVYSFTHWLSWIGMGILAILVPFFSLLKRRSWVTYKTAIMLHTFGNMTAFGMISIHFAQQMGRYAPFGMHLGTGFVIYIIISAIVLTGLLKSYRLLARHQSKWSFVHTGLALSLLFVVPAHVLSNFRFN
jgi:hypothetical protein